MNYISYSSRDPSATDHLIVPAHNEGIIAEELLESLHSNKVITTKNLIILLKHLKIISSYDEPKEYFIPSV